MDFWAYGRSKARDIAIWEWEQRQAIQAMSAEALAFMLRMYSGNAERPGTPQWDQRERLEAEAAWRRQGPDGPFR